MRNKQTIYYAAFLLTFCFLGVFSACQTNEKPKQRFSLQAGDLLFQDSDCGDFCQAIEAVTEGVEGYEFSHVGLVMEKQGELRVMEAITKGVVFTPLDSFLNRSFDTENRPKVIVGRLLPEYQQLIPEAVKFIETKKDAPYDYAFRLANDSFYCSELIHLAFLEANQGKPLFETPPMTFRSPSTDTTFLVWQRYFEELQLPIPEGELGLNPGSMSRSPYLRIVHRYGKPSH